jgi:hypothetical protein
VRSFVAISRILSVRLLGLLIWSSVHENSSVISAVVRIPILIRAIRGLMRGKHERKNVSSPLLSGLSGSRMRLSGVITRVNGVKMCAAGLSGVLSPVMWG